MKDIKVVSSNIYTVVSEPGDMTRYEYVVYRDGPDMFNFMSMKNSFIYPRSLNYFEVCNIDIGTGTDIPIKSEESEKLIELASKKGCNPYTLLECIRTVFEMHD